MPSTDAKETKHKNSTLPPLTIDLSSSQHPKYAHLWKEKKSQYDNRPPSGWRDILEQKSALRTLKRRGGLFQYEEKRRTRIAESGWKNITVILPEKPKKIDFEAMNALQKEELDKNGASLRNRGNYCFTCWGVVHADVNRAGCCHCMAVTHKACIVKTDGALKSSKDPFESTSWTCPDCVEDVDFNSHFQVIRQRQQYRESMEIFAIVKVQSFARMVRYRLDFIFAKIGFTCLQKLFHAKKAWTTLKSYEEKRPRPFRIRIQDVKLFVHSPDAVEGSTVDAGMLPDPVTRKIGEIGASIYDAHFKPGRHFEGTESSTDYMLEYLQHGHVEAPEYNMSCKENHPFPKGSLFLSVCVYELDSNWVDETDGDGAGTHARNLRQLYRVDAPLKLRKELKAEKITASMLSNLGVQGMDPLAFERVTDNFRLATFHIENPYILIPKCSPSVSVTLTVSQVTAWPRAIVVGQSAQVLKRLLYLHKVAAWHQWLSPCSWANLPELDEGRKLLITLPDTGTEGPRSKCKSPVQSDSRPTTASTTASVATQPKLGRPVSTTLPSIDPLPAPPSPKGKALLMKTTKKQAASPTDNANEVFGGVLSWSLLTMTNESQNEGGYLLSVPRGAGERGALVKREIWCVLVDQCFINYVSVDSIKPRVHADLKQYYVTPMAEGIFRIDSDRSASSSFKTLFFMGKNRKEGSRWFWKLYTQSASNSIQKYSSLNFHQGGDASAFVMTRTEGDEVGLGPGFDRKILLDDEDASSLKSGAPGLRTSSELALFRADPMLAFVYESDNGEDKNRESTDLNTGTVTRGRNNRGSLLQLMAARRPTFADIVGRSKSCDLADGGGNVDEDKDEDEVFMCSELTDAIAAAVEVTSRSVLHLPLTEEEEGEAEGLGEGEEVVTASVPVPDFNGPINVSASAATSILNSLCTTPRGLSPLQRACRDSRKAWKNRVASDNMSGNGVSKSRLARFAALRSTL